MSLSVIEVIVQRPINSRLESETNCFEIRKEVLITRIVSTVVPTNFSNPLSEVFKEVLTVVEEDR